MVYNQNPNPQNDFKSKKLWLPIKTLNPKVISNQKTQPANWWSNIEKKDYHAMNNFRELNQLREMDFVISIDEGFFVNHRGKRSTTISWTTMGKKGFRVGGIEEFQSTPRMRFW